MGIGGISGISVTSSRWFKVAIVGFVFIFFCLAFFHVAIAAFACAFISFLFEPTASYKLQNTAEYVVNINSFSHLFQSSSNPQHFYNGLSIIRVKKSVSLGAPITLRFSDECSALIDGFLGDTIPWLGGLDGTRRKHRSEDG